MPKMRILYTFISLLQFNLFVPYLAFTNFEKDFRTNEKQISRENPRKSTANSVLTSEKWKSEWRDNFILPASGLLDENWEDVYIRPRMARLTDMIVRRVVTSRTKSHLNLNVTCFSPSSRQMISGFLPNVNITFDELYFENLQITGGAKLQALGADFKVMAFPMKPFFRKSRALKKPLEVYGEVFLTQEDLVQSPAIRKAAQSLMDSLLSKALAKLPQFSEVIAVAVQKVSIRDESISFSGIVNSAVTSSIPFNVKTGLRVRGDGHVVILDKPELVLNAGSTLEVKVPILASGDIEIDIGNNAKLELVKIDEGKISVAARVLFSPVPPFTVSESIKRAVYFYDLGAFLSGLWGFHRL